MGEDEKWSSVSEDGTDFNGDVATEKFFLEFSISAVTCLAKIGPRSQWSSLLT